jgi:hypothetical protein
MKKIVLALVLTVFVLPALYASSWKNYDDFMSYKKLRAEANDASAAGNTESAIAKYKEAAVLAGKSDAKEIQAWQLNSAAFELIKSFKTLTGYSDKIEKISAMGPGKDKFALQKEAAKLFADNIALVDDAKQLLEEAKALNAGEGPADKINSNLDFVTWVGEFVADTNNPVEKKDASVTDAASSTVPVKADLKPVVKAAAKADAKSTVAEDKTAK